MTAPDPVLSAFDGPGELRALFRKMDWSATPLGDPHTWSPVLRTMVQNCLNSGFPFLIHWGPELVALYNTHTRQRSAESTRPPSALRLD